jgi:hypothetical protein
MILTDIGQHIFDLFRNLGDLGMFIAIAIVIWLDGAAFPTLPEAWLVFIWNAHPDPSFGFGLTLVLVATTASVAGTLSLYSVVKLTGLPKRIQKAMSGYTNWLIVNDERLLVLNRFAPLIPYTGAFIAANNWDIRKATIYLVGSALLKFSAWVTVFAVLRENIVGGLSPWISLALVAIVITASTIVSLTYRKKRKGVSRTDLGSGADLQ